MTGNLTNITIPDYDLYAGQIIHVRAIVLNALGANASSPIYTMTVPGVASGKAYCGVCQLADRTKCPQYNAICWTYYLNYTNTTIDYISDCLKAMAKTCYSVWKVNGTSDPQCIDFYSRYNYTLMSTRPNAIKAVYNQEGTLITVNFDMDINTVGFLDCSAILTSDTLKWLPAAMACQWPNNSTLQIGYQPTGDTLLAALNFVVGPIVNNYIYAQEPLNNSSVPVFKHNY